MRTEVSIVSCDQWAPRVSRPLVGRIDRQGIPTKRPRMPALRTGSIAPTFWPSSGEMYECSGGAPPKGDLGESIISAGYENLSALARESARASTVMNHVTVRVRLLQLFPISRPPLAITPSCDHPPHPQIYPPILASACRPAVAQSRAKSSPGLKRSLRRRMELITSLKMPLRSLPMPCMRCAFTLPRFRGARSHWLISLELHPASIRL